MSVPLAHRVPLAHADRNGIAKCQRQAEMENGDECLQRVGPMRTGKEPGTKRTTVGMFCTHGARKPLVRFVPPGGRGRRNEARAAERRSGGAAGTGGRTTFPSAAVRPATGRLIRCGGPASPRICRARTCGSSGRADAVRCRATAPPRTDCRMRAPASGGCTRAPLPRWSTNCYHPWQKCKPPVSGRGRRPAGRCPWRAPAPRQSPAVRRHFQESSFPSDVAISSASITSLPLMKTARSSTFSSCARCPANHSGASGPRRQRTAALAPGRGGRPACPKNAGPAVRCPPAGP